MAGYARPFLPGLVAMEGLIHADSFAFASLPRGSSDVIGGSFIGSRPINLQIEKVAGLHGPSERGNRRVGATP